MQKPSMKLTAGQVWAGGKISGPSLKFTWGTWSGTDVCALYPKNGEPVVVTTPRPYSAIGKWLYRIFFRAEVGQPFFGLICASNPRRSVEFYRYRSCRRGEMVLVCGRYYSSSTLVTISPENFESLVKQMHDEGIDAPHAHRLLP